MQRLLAAGLGAAALVFTAVGHSTAQVADAPAVLAIDPAPRAQAGPSATTPVPAPRASVPLPTVPAGTVPRGVQANVVERTGGAVLVSLGKNNIFPVSQGHINRIVTPFRRAGVRTTSTEEITSEGGIVYVSPRSEAPVTMFISEASDESLAISLTLVPRGIPPVELDLRLPGHVTPRSPIAVQERAARAEQADRWERAQPFSETLSALVRRLALGEVPPGYELAAIGGGLTPPVCSAPGGVRVSFARGQAFLGANLVAFVGVVHNSGREPVEFVESWCGARGVAAVALAPSPMLQPGGRAEIFVVVRNAPSEPRGTPRPSLLQAGARR